MTTFRSLVWKRDWTNEYGGILKVVSNTFPKYDDFLKMLEMESYEAAKRS